MKSLQFFSRDLGENGAYLNLDNDLGINARTVTLILLVSHVLPAYKQTEEMKIDVTGAKESWENDHRDVDVCSWAIRLLEHETGHRYQWRVYLVPKNGDKVDIGCVPLYDVGSDEDGGISIVPAAAL